MSIQYILAALKELFAMTVIFSLLQLHMNTSGAAGTESYVVMEKDVCQHLNVPTAQ